MSYSDAGLTGFRGVRKRLLVAVKKSQPVAVKKLAADFRITANALRRHLKILEDSGFVRYRREIRGVGGPTFAYSLTEAGEALFPRAYSGALAEALGVIHERQGLDGVLGVFRRQWDSVTNGSSRALDTPTLAERAHALAELRTKQGYMAEVVAGDGEVVIREHNCAIRDVAERFPEICAAEERFFAELLGASVHREAHILAGCNSCEYRVHEVPPDPARQAPWHLTEVEEQS